MESVTVCPSCGSRSQFARERVGAGGSHGPDLLPRLGRWRGMLTAKMTVVVCAECGLMRLFASREARDRLQESGAWHRIDARDR